MNYPPGFSPVSRARVAAAKVDAEIAFTQKTRHTRQIEDVEKELLILIGVVTLAFAKQACVAGVELGWDIEAIHDRIEEFFKDFCRNSYYAKHPAPGREDEYESFEWDMWRGLQDSDAWLEHRERLIVIATARIEAAKSTTAAVGREAETATDKIVVELKRRGRAAFAKVPERNAIL